MMSDTPQQGHCLCGQVRYRAVVPMRAGACHCSMCRRWGSGPMMAVHAVGPIEFDGVDAIATYASSAWAERGFCRHCGTNLFYHLLPREGMPDGQWILSAGTLADGAALSFDSEIYVDHAPGWYAFARPEQRQRLTEAELLASFAPPPAAS